MAQLVKQVFEKRIITISLDCLAPSRQPRRSDNSWGKYDAILASVRAMGLVEPLAVHPVRGKPGHYVVLDGHLRIRALRDLGITEANCLIAREDDPFTYNDKANRLSSIQEHRMLMKAIDQGVTADEIARTLGINIERIRASMNLLKGIHGDAVEKLKDKPIAPGALRVFRKVKPIRQMEFADLMVSTGDYTAVYANALLLATPANLLVSPEEPKVNRNLKPEDVHQMEREMENLERDFRVYQDRYGENALSLNVIQRYVQRLLDNKVVVRFLSKRYPEIFEELSVVATMETL